jgi:hypothetical protein
MIPIINQLFEIEQKLQTKGETIAERNFKRIYHELEIEGYKIINPIGKKYQETDTTVEATLSGTLKGNATITRVLKPVIYKQEDDGQLKLLQKGIVIVEGV